MSNQEAAEVVAWIEAAEARLAQIQADCRHIAELLTSALSEDIAAARRAEAALAAAERRRAQRVVPEGGTTRSRP
jgi:multidrug resistance efflux pump